MSAPSDAGKYTAGSFSLSSNKKINRKPSIGRNQHSFTVSELFTETFHAPLQRFVWRRHIGVPFWCSNMAARNQQKHLKLTFSIKTLSFYSRTSIRAHKHIF